LEKFNQEPRGKGIRGLMGCVLLVEQLPNYTKFEGLNPATSGTSRKQAAGVQLQLQLVEQSINNPELVGSNLAEAGTRRKRHKRANGGLCGLVEQLPNYPKFEGLNPATSGTSRKQAAGVQLFEQSTNNLKLVGSNPAAAETRGKRHNRANGVCVVGRAVA
jgi:hypothetical protein